MTTQDALTTAQFIETVVRILDELFFPALALWLATMVRQWVKGSLQPPPYRHEVRLQEPMKYDADARGD